MKRWILALTLAVLSTEAFAEIYRWVDDEGRVHFGDRPSGRTRSEVVEPKRSTDPPPAKRGHPAGAVSDQDRGCFDFMETAEFAAWSGKDRRRYKARCSYNHSQHRQLVDGVREDDQRRKREEAKRQRRAFADRYAEEESQRLRRRDHVDDGWNELDPVGRRDAERPERWDDEAYCQKTYGKSCGELANWKRDAIERCERGYAARDCRDPEYLKSKKPLTKDQLRLKDLAKDQIYLDREQRRRQREHLR